MADAQNVKAAYRQLADEVKGSIYFTLNMFIDYIFYYRFLLKLVFPGTT